MASISPKFLNCFTVLSDVSINSWILRCPYRIGHPLDWMPEELLGSPMLFTAARLRVIGEKLEAIPDEFLRQGETRERVCIFGVPIFSAVLDLLISYSLEISIGTHENTSSSMLWGSSVGALIVLIFLPPSSSLALDMKILLKIS